MCYLPQSAARNKAQVYHAPRNSVSLPSGWEHLHPTRSCREEDQCRPVPSYSVCPARSSAPKTTRAKCHPRAYSIKRKLQNQDCPTGSRHLDPRLFHWRWSWSDSHSARRLANACHGIPNVAKVQVLQCSEGPQRRQRRQPLAPAEVQEHQVYKCTNWLYRRHVAAEAEVKRTQVCQYSAR
jgi:hypothetical protein